MTINIIEKHFYEWKCPQCGLTAKKEIKGESKEKKNLVCWNCNADVTEFLSQQEPQKIHPLTSLKKPTHRKADDTEKH